MTSSDPTPTTEQVREALSKDWVLGLDDIYGVDWFDRWQKSLSTPGDHDELLADLDVYARNKTLDNYATVAARAIDALRTEQRARQALIQAALDHRNTAGAALNRAGRAEAERDALRQRNDAALAILSWMPDHDGDDKNRVEQDYMYRAQLADEAYAALSESHEPDHEQ